MLVSYSVYVLNDFRTEYTYRFDIIGGKSFVKLNGNKERMTKLTNTTILQDNSSLLSGLQCNTLASLDHLAHNEVN